MALILTAALFFCLFAFSLPSSLFFSLPPFLSFSLFSLCTLSLLL